MRRPAPIALSLVSSLALASLLVDGCGTQGASPDGDPAADAGSAPGDAETAPAIASLRVEDLRCEYLTDPLAIDTPAPRLGWRLTSPERAQLQSAYRVLVASDPSLVERDEGDLWDSGRVASDRSLHVEYAGRRLDSTGQRCWWKVRVWDSEGRPSPWSRVATWSMGLLEPEDWEPAKWITHDTSAEEEDPTLFLPPSPYLRREFEVESEVERAVVHVTALGLFELEVNGQRVGEDWFTPGWTNYAKRVHYMTYDVTREIVPGTNAVGAVLSPGWYSGYVGFGLLTGKGKEGRAFYGEHPALLARLEIRYRDGRTTAVATDESWLASTGAVRASDLQMGETHDARREMPGWSRGGFDASTWVPASVAEVEPGTLEAYPGVPVRVTGEVSTAEITQPRPGVWVVDLGQNIAGRARLRVKGPEGTKVTMRFAEMLHRDGTIMTENLRKARATDVYILRGDEEGEVWEPRFTYHGFRYVELTGLAEDPTPETVTGVVMHSDTPLVGSLETSDEMVNQLVRNIVWTQRGNFVEVPTDCPQRDERLGWTGDAQIYIRSACWNADVAAFFKRWLVTLEDDMRPSGSYTDFAPLPYLQNEPSPGWRDAGVICPWTLWRVYGDTRVIERHFDAMERFMEFQAGLAEDHVVRVPDNCWGDWLATGEKPTKEYIATAYYAYDASLMAEMAKAIGRDDAHTKYTELAAAVRRAIVDRFVAPEDGKIESDTQTAYAMAIYMDLLPEDLRRKAGEHLVRRIRAANDHLTTGFLGVKPLLPALSAMGEDALAYRLLLNTTYPSWGYEIVNGATTIWERWNSYTKDKGFANPSMNSFSHYAFGSVCEWMHRSMVGIEAEEPGFGKLRIAPRLGDGKIQWVRARHASIRGRIEAGWKVEGAKLALDIALPAGCIATVRVPTRSVADVREGGVPAAEAEGVQFIRTEEDAAIYRIGSGAYSFTSRVPLENLGGDR